MYNVLVLTIYFLKLIHACTWREYLIAATPSGKHKSKARKDFPRWSSGHLECRVHRLVSQHVM